MKKLYLLIYFLLIIVTLFFPAIISFATWNFWYMLLFFVSWIPSLFIFYIGLSIGILMGVMD